MVLKVAVDPKESPSFSGLPTQGQGSHWFSQANRKLEGQEEKPTGQAMGSSGEKLAGRMLAGPFRGALVPVLHRSSRGAFGRDL